MKTITIAGLEFEEREFTNSERLAGSAYEKLSDIKKVREGVLESKKKLDNLPKHPVKQRIERELKKKEAENAERAKKGIVLSEDEQLQFDLEVYELQEQFIEYMDKIAREMRLEDQYNLETIAGWVQLSRLNLSFLYFLKVHYDAESAENILSADDQVKNFLDSKDEDEAYKKFMEAATTDPEIEDEEGKKVSTINWVKNVEALINAGNGIGSTAEPNRKQRRAEERQQKKAAKKTPKEASQPLLLTTETA